MGNLKGELAGASESTAAFTWADAIKAEGKMPKEENDLRDRTKDFALRIMRMFSLLPKTTEAQTLGKQALRSGTAAGANYREAYRGRSKAEFISKCGDSLRELEETGYWLEFLVDGKIVEPTKLSALRQECDEPSQFSSQF